MGPDGSTMSCWRRYDRRISSAVVYQGQRRPASRTSAELESADSASRARNACDFSNFMESLRSHPRER